MKYIFFLLAMFAAGVAHSAAPSANCSVNRTSGKAPLYVHRDCTATTGVTGHTGLFETSFGDTSAGSWNYGANIAASKNYALGIVSGHVYQTAGTYTITTRVCNSSGECAVDTDTITVSAWAADGTTICVANGALPVAGEDGCPAGSTVANQSSWATIIGYLKTGTTCAGGTVICDRVLLRRGDTFTSSAAGTWAVSGTTQKAIGAYGPGANPIIQASASGYFLVYTAANAAHGDLSIENVSFNCNSQSSTGVVDFSQPFTRWTGIRLSATNCTANVMVLTPAADVYMDQLAVQDSTFGPVTTGQYHLFGGSTNSYFGGNYFNGPTGSGGHNVRTGYLNKSIVQNNTSENGTGDAWKIHGPPFASASQVSQYIVVAGNKFIGSSSTITLWISPQSGAVNEHIEDVYVFSNWLTAATGSAQDGAARIDATRITFANNLLDLSNSTGATGIRVVNEAGSPAPDSLWFYNNTIYSSKAAGFVGLNVASGVAPTDGIFLTNNLAYAPNATGTPSILSDGGAGVITLTTNSPNAPSTCDVLDSPSFDGPLTAPQGFRFATTSCAQNLGTAVFPASNSDFFNCDDTTANEHIGAFVPRVRAQCRGVAGP